LYNDTKRIIINVYNLIELKSSIERRANLKDGSCCFVFEILMLLGRSWVLEVKIIFE